MCAALPRVASGRAEGFEDRLDLAADEVADGAEFVGREVLGVGDLPVLAALGLYPRARVAAAQGGDEVELHVVGNLGERLGAVAGEVVAELAHGFDGLGV